MARHSHRLASVVLLAGGVLLVFAGLTTALGLSTSGMIASAAAIAALLYAGGVWFGASAAQGDAAVVLFTPQLTVAAGPFTGRALVDLYPAPFRPEIDAHCRAACAGASSRFSPAPGRTFEAAPVRAADGAIVYGILIAGAATPERAALSA